MPDISDNTNWFELDTQNSRPPPNGWPEGQMPSTVNDCARANMGSLKRFWNRVNPVQSISGSGGVYTFTTSNPAYPTSYVNGEVYTFQPGTDAVGSDQFQVNALAALPIYKRDFAAGWLRLAAHDIASGRPAQLIYLSTLNAGAGGFQLVNPFTPTSNDGAGGLSVAGNVVAGGLVQGAQVNAANISASGQVSATSISATGPNAAIEWTDRTTGAEWLWYATGGVARLWENGDRFSVDTSGNITVIGAANIAGLVQSPDGVFGVATVGGVTFGGGGNVTAPGTLQVGGSLYVGGCQWYNNGGWMFTPQSLQTNAGFQANGGGTAINAPNGAVISGTFVQANGGGTAFYAPYGNVSIGGFVVIAGSNPGSLGLQCTSGAVEADHYGTSFYAPNGNVVCVECHANAFVNTSDEALKTGIADTDIGLDVIRSLSPKSFCWPDTPDREELGLIAQDVAAVLPQAVLTSTDELHAPRMGVNYAAINAALINAVKELAARVATLEAK